MDIGHIRQEYAKYGLRRKDMESGPFLQFHKWFRDSEISDQLFHNSVSLATATKEGIPTIRTVLLKKVDESGFVFFTNYSSNKARDIDENPNVSLLFFWPELERQVIVQGIAEKISQKASCEYFQSRPYTSQLGAWASRQSEVVSGRKVLEENFDNIRKRFCEKKIPCPDFWGGYRVKPVTMEFWQGRTNRLHDRLRYRRDDKDTGNHQWILERLSP